MCVCLVGLVLSLLCVMFNLVLLALFWYLLIVRVFACGLTWADCLHVCVVVVFGFCLIVLGEFVSWLW